MICIRHRSLRSYRASILLLLLFCVPSGIWADMLPEYRPRGREVLHIHLIEACIAGKLDDARSLLKRGASPTWEIPMAHRPGGDDDVRSGPAVLTSVQWGYVEILRMLLDERPQLLERYGGPLLVEALSVRAGQPERYVKILKLLIERKVDVNFRPSAGQRTPLMHAAARGNVDAVRLLLEAGADASRKDSDGATALSIARSARSPEPAHAAIIKLLEPVTK